MLEPYLVNLTSSLVMWSCVWTHSGSWLRVGWDIGMPERGSEGVYVWKFIFYQYIYSMCTSNQDIEFIIQKSEDKINACKYVQNDIWRKTRKKYPASGLSLKVAPVFVDGAPVSIQIRKQH